MEITIRVLWSGSGGNPTYDVVSPGIKKKGFNRAADWRDVQLRDSPSTHSSFPQVGWRRTTDLAAVVTLGFLYSFFLERQKNVDE